MKKKPILKRSPVIWLYLQLLTTLLSWSSLLMNFFITRVSRSLFNFISTIIISKSVVWLALKVALFKYFLYLQDVSCVFVNLSWWWSRSVESPATGLRVLAGVLRFCSIQSIATNLSEFKTIILKLASQCLKHLQGVH